jgi:hypothetical protein
VGGSRLRPCVEDLLQFLIDECRFDALDGWKERVDSGRENWTRTQVTAIVRDIHIEAARVLQDLGYTVTPPENLAEESRKALRAW